jgi:hypothetical protein
MSSPRFDLKGTAPCLHTVLYFDAHPQLGSIAAFTKYTRYAWQGLLAGTSSSDI